MSTTVGADAIVVAGGEIVAMQCSAHGIGCLVLLALRLDLPPSFFVRHPEPSTLEGRDVLGGDRGQVTHLRNEEVIMLGKGNAADGEMCGHRGSLIWVSRFVEGLRRQRLA